MIISSNKLRSLIRKVVKESFENDDDTYSKQAQRMFNRMRDMHPNDPNYDRSFQYPPESFYRELSPSFEGIVEDWMYETDPSYDEAECASDLASTVKQLFNKTMRSRGFSLGQNEYDLLVEDFTTTLMEASNSDMTSDQIVSLLITACMEIMEN
jgi:hypothetical protein